MSTIEMTKRKLALDEIYQQAVKDRVLRPVRPRGGRLFAWIERRLAYRLDHFCGVLADARKLLEEAGAKLTLSEFEHRA